MASPRWQVGEGRQFVVDRLVPSPGWLARLRSLGQSAIPPVLASDRQARPQQHLPLAFGHVIAAAGLAKAKRKLGKCTALQWTTLLVHCQDRLTSHQSRATSVG